MQTILGAGGAIGKPLAKVLPRYTDKVRLVGRQPEKINPDDELLAADLLNAEEVDLAVKGSKIVYLTVGLAYDIQIWQASWPVIMENVINACEKHKASLVFFDNIYMYTADLPVPFDENTRIDPPSKKGVVRKELADMVLNAHKNKRIKALIARSADFYGPGAGNVSMLDQLVLKNLKAGKKANWLMRKDKVHSMTYTPDAAIGTALLGNTSFAYGRVWHLPTASDPLTGQQWTELAASKLGASPRLMVVGKLMIGLIGLFQPVMKEIKEMVFQYDRDYVFDSHDFQKSFHMKPTSYEDGLEQVLRKDYGWKG